MNKKAYIFYKLILVIACCSFMLFFGCKKNSESKKENIDTTTTDIPVKTLLPEITITPDPTSTPIPTPVIPISTADPNVEKEKLMQIVSTVNMFEQSTFCIMDSVYLAKDFVSFEDEFSLNAQWSENMLESLKNVDREALNMNDQIVYDTLRIYFQNIISVSEVSDYNFLLYKNEYGYVKLPMILYYFHVENESDVQKIVELLNISENYFHSLKNVMNGLHTEETEKEMSVFTSKKFKKAFSERLEKQIQSCQEMERQDKKSAIKEVQQLLEEVFYPSLTDLKNMKPEDLILDINEALYSEKNATNISDEDEQNMSNNDSAEENAELAEMEEKDEGYAEDENKTVKTFIQNELISKPAISILTEVITGGTGTDEIIKLLEDSADNLLTIIRDLQDRNPSFVYDKMHFDKYSNEKTEQRLKKATEEYLDLKIKTDPEMLYSDGSLQEITQPVTFLDGAVWMNAKKLPENQFFEIANETYPGAALCFIQNSEQILSFLPCYAYIKGWGRYSTESILLQQNIYDMEEATFYFANETLYEYILPSLIYLYSNAEGLSNEDIISNVSVYMQLFKSEIDVDANAQYLNYEKYVEAVSYVQMSDLFVEISGALGDRYIEKDALKQYLSYGPSYFTILRERMDAWASEQSSY